MTSPSRARGRAGDAPAKPSGANPERAALRPRPFKPRRRLFLVLMIGFVLWVAGLLVMYFTTAYSTRGRLRPDDGLARPLDLR